jgi:hypothetical protein
LGKAEAQQGVGAVAEQASDLASNIYGFEIMVGPFAVSELRVTRALADRGAKLPAGGSHVYLTDTLESPNATPAQLPLYLKPIAEQHAKALKVKAAVPVIVCLGNPPYKRGKKGDKKSKAFNGGWVCWGDEGSATNAIFRAFLDPAIAAGQGRYVKNLYNLYVYFWRWALWKVFESKTAPGPGIASFISASSYLRGEAFCGMREHMRRVCDEIWILDLGGEGRGGRKSENIFEAVITPVAIALGIRFAKADTDTPAKVRYARIDGTRQEKLRALGAITNFASLGWEDCPSGWQATFTPDSCAPFVAPALGDLFPWTARGIQFSRNWPVCPRQPILLQRWTRLLDARSDQRPSLLVETRDVRADRSYPSFLSGNRLQSIGSARRASPPDAVERVLFRSFDRQWCIADRRVIDMPRPPLWQSRSDSQVFLLTAPDELTEGPGLVAGSDVPDLNAFNNRGGLAYPLYRDAQGNEPNILPGLLDMLARAYDRKVTPEDFLAYVYGALAHPGFTEMFADEFRARELRVPLTKDPGLFAQVRHVGAKLLWVHTYGQRFAPRGKHLGQVPKGATRCVKGIPGDPAGYPGKYEYNDAMRTLNVGAGEFAPVAPEVYGFEVSGLRVVQSWLGYRMKEPKGKRSSPLDEIMPDRWPSEFTTELLELLWILEATIAEYPAQAKLLSAVVKGPCFKADELPAVPDAARKPPARPTINGLYDAVGDEEE